LSIEEVPRVIQQGQVFKLKGEVCGWGAVVGRERFGIEADEIDGGHYITLSRPLEQRCQHIASFLGTAPIG
jgi:hypothetical protein